MSVPQHKRETARREILKQAKALEQYTIKKTCNYSQFHRRRYRSFLVDDLIAASVKCYNYLILGFYSWHTPEQQLTYFHNAFAQLEILDQQLDAANTLYETPIQGIEYWGKLISNLKDEINAWVVHIQM